jgi:DNA repair photolyase
MHRRFRDGEPWAKMVADSVKIADTKKAFKGVVMFPTTHDITPSVLPQCLQTLHNLLGSGNQVLIVSKPHLSVIKTLCKDLFDYRCQILFRFTIGSLNPKICQLWEPGAPCPAERIEALKHAYSSYFMTSVSVEPMLGDNDEISRLVTTIDPFVTDTIWLGKLNGGVMTKHLPVPEAVALKNASRTLRQIQSDDYVLELVKALKDNPKVRWKDSIKKVLAAAAEKTA